ncbi:MAG: hypothetical protein RR588_02040 [Solibacillus sp.]
MSNALDALLGAKPVSEITAKVSMERLGTEFTVKALTMDDISQLKEEATYYTGDGKNRKANVNEEKLGLLMLVAATVEPNFKDKAVLSHFDAKTAMQAVKKALLPGEFSALSTAVTQISGLDPATEDDIDEAKN